MLLFTFQQYEKKTLKDKRVSIIQYTWYCGYCRIIEVDKKNYITHENYLYHIIIIIIDKLNQI